MRIVISALHFVWQDIEECFDRLGGELGLDGVELSWHTSFARPHCTREDMEAVRRLGPASGFELSAHIWENPARLGPGPAEEALRSWLGHCAPAGVSALVIHGGSYDDRREGVARTRRILENVLPEFEAAGVTLLLENHYAYDYRDCRELFSETWEFEEVFSLDSPALGFCLDTGHAHMTANMPELVERLAPRLRYVHLADNDGRDDLHWMFERGTVPFRELFAQLHAAGFDGTFCVEFPVRDDLAPFRECVAQIRELW